MVRGTVCPAGAGWPEVLLGEAHHDRSHDYFCIVEDLNLFCVPLTEVRFLLHLPDLYHELAHPLLIERDDPVVEPFQEAHFKALGDALGYLAAEKRKEDRRRGPRQPAFTLTRWEAAWMKYWMVELFCDLFAVYGLARRSPGRTFT